MAASCSDPELEELRQRILVRGRDGHLAEAAGLADELLTRAPQLATAWQLRGAIALAAADVLRAIACFRSAATLAPGDEAIQSDLASALFEARRYADAMAACGQALAQIPGSARLWFTLGAASVAAGRSDQGEAAYRRALELDPAQVDAAVNLAVLLQQRGRLPDALALYGRALERQPQHRIGLTNCAAALIASRRFDAAVPLLRRVLADHPDDVFANANLGLGLTELPAFAEGVALLHRASHLSGNPVYALKADLAIPPLLASRDQILEFRVGLEQRIDRLLDSRLTFDDPLAAMAKTGFYLAYQGLDDRVLQEKTARLYAQACPSLRFIAAHCVAAVPPTGRRIRIGFVSTFLREHTIGKLFRGLISELDRGDFECMVFAPRVPGDPVQESFVRQGIAVVPLPPTLDEARQRIAGARLDILFYPDIGMSPFTYCLAFARLAPVQFTSWGHPVTTGIATVDGFLSHADCELGDTRDQYTERLVCLPKGVSYTRYLRPEHRGGRKSRRDFGLPADRTLYLCPHSVFKLHPDFVAALQELLRADPNALLVLVGPVQGAWREVVLQRLGPVADERNVRFTGAVTPEDFVELLAVGDVLLDSFHFGGGNTTAEALGTGIPIVTLPGSLLRGRFTYAWLAYAGIDAGIAVSASDYVERALRFGQDAALNQAIREATLAAAERLYDDTGCVREFEAVLRASLAGPAALAG